MTPMLAFHNDPAVKAKYLARVRRHRKADELVRGEGWTGFKGSAVGCTLEGCDHSRYPGELGIPEVLAHLEDRLFEGMPQADAMEWPAAFLSAIKVGADLSGVWPRFAYWLLTEELPDVDPVTRAAIDGVAGLLASQIGGVDPSLEDWREASAEAAGAAWAAGAAGAASYLRQSVKLLALLRAAPVSE